MLKHFFILCTACSFWIVAVTVFMSACSKNNGNGSHEEATIKLFLGKLEIPMFDSISICISAADMESIRITEVTTKDNIKIDAIPQGESRKFEVKIYADSGKLVQKGEATADIIAGENASIPIVLNALAGFLRMEIPLGIPNNTGIHSGKLFLDSLTFNMTIENGKGLFNTNSLPLDKNFNLRVELYNVNGEIIFTGYKNIKLSSILQTETIQLQSTMGSAILELQASLNGPNQILAMLPESAFGYRAPENYGDLFFTEIFADPLDGDNYQYMEIYNITLDTLLLSSCKIARDKSDSPTGGKINMPKDLVIPPMKYLLLGRNAVENADYNYGTYSLLKTGQSLGFFCEDLIVDTLTYSNKGDNAFPLEKGKAMQLPLTNYVNRTQGAYWCFGFSPKTDAECL